LILARQDGGSENRRPGAIRWMANLAEIARKDREMKVLVTGGAGFIGSHVVDGLIALGHQVVVVDNLSTGYPENLNPGARFYQLDIRSRELLRVFERERPDIVNHHGAQMSVRVSMQDPLLDAQVNVLGSLNVIEACKAYGVSKLIYISTGGAVYGEPQYLPCDEAHPVNPLCQYGATKHMAEHYLFIYRKLYGLNYTVLRYPNVYGPRQDPFGEAGVVAIFTQQMLGGQPVIINGSGAQERDFVYISDVVRANLLALRSGDGEIINIGWGKGTSVNRIFQTLKAITSYAINPVYAPAIPGEVFKICLDPSKAKQLLDWQPCVTLKAGLASTVEYFRSHPNHYVAHSFSPADASDLPAPVQSFDISHAGSSLRHSLPWEPIACPQPSYPER